MSRFPLRSAPGAAAKVSDLQTLDNPTTPSSSGNPWPAIAPGGKYPKSTPKTVDECPSDAPRRPYDITAIQMGITYNSRSAHDGSAHARADRRRPQPGAAGFGGDYLVRSASTTNQVSAGLWGLCGCTRRGSRRARMGQRGRLTRSGARPTCGG